MAEAVQEYVPFEKAMEQLALSRAELYRHVKDAKIKGEKHDHRLRFAVAEVERYAQVLHQERDNLEQVASHWLGFFGDRLSGVADAELADVAASPVGEKVAELGRRIIQDALGAEFENLYVDPLRQGDRLLYGARGRQREIARFEAGLTDPLKTWFKGLAPLPALDENVKISETVGQFSTEKKKVQFRLTVVPTLLGEHLHFHFFPDFETGNLEDLGYTPLQVSRLRSLLRGRPGLLLLAGAGDPEDERHRMVMAQELSAEGRLVTALEHKVQYRSDALVQLDLAQGPGFGVLWRTALGMSPESMLLDEVQNAEEARALIEGFYSGAMTVGLVRSSGAFNALEQLFRFEIDRETLAAGLAAVVERTVLRRLCPHCRDTRPLEQGEGDQIGLPSATEVGVAKGCERCGDGYLGRRTIYGIWLADKGLTTWIRTEEGRERPPPACGELALAAGIRHALKELEISLEDGRTLLDGLEDSPLVPK